MPASTPPRNPARSPRVLLLLLPCLLVFGLAFAGFRQADAQSLGGSPPSQTSIFSGALTQPTTGTIVTATTLASSPGGPPIINPNGAQAAPGYVVPNARIHVTHISAYASTATVVRVQEHPSTGPNKDICLLGLGTALPYDALAGTAQMLGANGYITAPGSSIVLLIGPTSATISGTITYTLE
jgi:hypothetical protein